MHGAIIICSVHTRVFNSSKREWQVVSEETMGEFRAMAEEVGNVDVYEGCCLECNEIASKSFQQLYASRYFGAMYAEFGSDLIGRWEDIE